MKDLRQEILDNANTEIINAIKAINEANKALLSLFNTEESDETN